MSKKDTSGKKTEAATPVSFDPKDFKWSGGIYEKSGKEGLKKDIIRHIVSSLGSDYARLTPYNYYHGLALAVRDRLIDQWIKTQRSYYDEHAKRVYYLSLEYLPGKSLLNNLHCLGLYETAEKVLRDFGLELEDLAEVEWDAGLGNGGLGRLASCFMDSIATLGISGYGYGIRYDYGIFHQVIDERGEQVEKCDNWMRAGDPWEFARGQFLTPVKFGGRVIEYKDEAGHLRHKWVDADTVLAMACDLLVPGYGNGQVINMRLWSARSDQEFNLKYFNTGDYIGAVQEKVKDENISKVLYPNDEAAGGRELRLKQQYFFVAATIRDILRRFTKKNENFDLLPDKVAIQLNDTHPSIAIPELMRILVDEHFLEWNRAWNICRQTFAYTNHTLLPEALETWPVELIGRLLPRHLQIIYEINRRFLEEVARRFPGDVNRIRHMSLINEEGQKNVRMANLAIVGSASVNGVSAMHSELLKDYVFKDFHEWQPTLLNNKTNGVTPRRWLLQCNPLLAQLLTEKLGKGWITDLDALKEIAPLAEDKKFRDIWHDIKQRNKEKLAQYILRKVGVEVNLQSMFDVHIKRIHEYKRQLMNILHVITMYNRIKDNPGQDFTPRTVIFAGKAAPSYFMAKRIIRLINAVAKSVNSDPLVGEKLKVIFLPNYCVSQAERIIPATELSQQISTAGMEASGTGNMKFSLNGAVIVGTLDGANIEMLEQVGKENMFIFGHTAEELTRLRASGYNPWDYYESEGELRRALEDIRNNVFSPQEHGLFQPIYDSLLHQGDHFFVLADFRSYLNCQDRIAKVYHDTDTWTRHSILNTANMGMFSSDRTIRQYAEDIWKVKYQSR
jgi:glycogen phosphorylase